MTGFTADLPRRLDPDEQADHWNNEFVRTPCHPQLAEKSLAELARGFAMFGEELGIGSDLPVPPKGLPGICNRKPSVAAMDLIRAGAAYAIAMARGEKRSLWNLHDEVMIALTTAHREGRREAEQEELERRTEATRARLDATEARSIGSVVYFIRSGDGPIKIGLALDVEKRLRGLQTAHHEPLSVLAVTGGGQPQEIAYHRRFAAHRLHGEWFEPHEDILAEIERLKADGGK